MNDLKNAYYSELFFFIKPTYICFMSKSGLNCVTRVAMEKLWCTIISFNSIYTIQKK